MYDYIVSGYTVYITTSVYAASVYKMYKHNIKVLYTYVYISSANTI